VSVVCCQVQVSGSGLTLIQRSVTESSVPECDREASIMRRNWPNRGCCAMEKNIIIKLLHAWYWPFYSDGDSSNTHTSFAKCTPSGWVEQPKHVGVTSSQHSTNNYAQYSSLRIYIISHSLYPHKYLRTVLCILLVSVAKWLPTLHGKNIKRRSTNPVLLIGTICCY
jgi:hypothetical protein